MEDKQKEIDKRKELARKLKRLQEYPEWEAFFELVGQHMDRHNQVRGIRSEKEALRRHERLIALDELWAEIIELPRELENSEKNETEVESEPD